MDSGLADTVVGIIVSTDCLRAYETRENDLWLNSWMIQTMHKLIISFITLLYWYEWGEVQTDMVWSLLSSTEQDGR